MVINFRTELSDGKRKGNIQKDCNTITEACQKNHFLCAEEILDGYGKSKANVAGHGKSLFDEALFAAVEFDSFEVVKVTLFEIIYSILLSRRYIIAALEYDAYKFFPQSLRIALVVIRWIQSSPRS